MLPTRKVSLFRRPVFNNELGNIYKQNYDGNTFEPLLKLVNTPADDCGGVQDKVRQLGWFAHICGRITMAGAYGGIILNHYFINFTFFISIFLHFMTNIFSNL